MRKGSSPEAKPRRYWRGSLLAALLCVGVLAVACGTPAEEIVPTVTRIPDAANAPVIEDETKASPTAELAQVTGEAATAPAEVAEQPAAAGEATAPVEEVAATGDVAKGQQLASICLSCHSVDGSTLVGPTWKGLYGHEVTLSDGTTVTADDAYIAQSIRDPNSQIVDGFPPAMPPFANLSDEDIADLIAYIKSLD